MTDQTTIPGLIITLLGALVTTFVIPLIKKNTTAKQCEELMAYARIAVLAAKQLTKAGSSNLGNVKSMFLNC